MKPHDEVAQEEISKWREKLNERFGIGQGKLRSLDVAQAEKEAAIAAAYEDVRATLGEIYARDGYMSPELKAIHDRLSHAHTAAMTERDARDKRVREDALRAKAREDALQEAAEKLGNLHDGFTYRPRDMKRHVLQMIDRTAEGEE